jgi:hypothetical protein
LTVEPATGQALDAALRAHAAPHLTDDGEVIVSWLALAATRRADGGGVVICLPSDGVMPVWEVIGILHETLRAIAVDEDDE